MCISFDYLTKMDFALRNIGIEDRRTYSKNKFRHIMSLVPRDKVVHDENNEDDLNDSASASDKIEPPNYLITMLYRKGVIDADADSSHTDNNNNNNDNNNNGLAVVRNNGSQNGSRNSPFSSSLRRSSVGSNSNGGGGASTGLNDVI